MKYYKCPRCKNIKTYDKLVVLQLDTCRNHIKMMGKCNTEMNYKGDGFLGWLRAKFTR